MFTIGISRQRPSKYPLMTCLELEALIRLPESSPEYGDSDRGSS